MAKSLPFVRTRCVLDPPLSIQRGLFGVRNNNVYSETLERCRNNVFGASVKGSGRSTGRILRNQIRGLVPPAQYSNDCKQFIEQPEVCETKIESPKVVIIGAGIAGLSAAVRLINAGFNDLLILEATERPGGRIYSCWLGTTVAEIGAQWISGSTLANPIIPLASLAGLLESPHEYSYSTGTYMASDGRPLDPLVSSHAYLAFQQIMKQAYTLNSIVDAHSHGSLKNFITIRIDQELKNFPVSQRRDAARIMYGLVNKISNRWGVELESLSADLFGCFVPLTGKTIGLPGGFITLLSPLIKEIPKSNIRYSKIVEKIQWRDVPNARTMIKTCDQCVFPADYVIVTVSLGVLKNSGKTMFSPKLPEDKRKAINLMGFGNITKIFLEYNRPFWIPKHGPIKFAWTPEEVNKGDSWLKGLHCLEELPGSQNILLATVSGSNADMVEDLKDMEIAEHITALLRRFTQDPTIPYPNSILRSKWKSSPYFHGTTSYMSMCASLDLQDDLMKPVPNTVPNKTNDSYAVIPKLFFAGEAMSKTFFSTVHGARLSGLRAADEIVTITNKIKAPPPKTDQYTYDPGEDSCDIDV